MNILNADDGIDPEMITMTDDRPTPTRKSICCCCLVIFRAVPKCSKIAADHHFSGKSPRTRQTRQEFVNCRSNKDVISPVTFRRATTMAGQYRRHSDRRLVVDEAA